jgi:hypothetical protein
MEHWIPFNVWLFWASKFWCYNHLCKIIIFVFDGLSLQASTQVRGKQVSIAKPTHEQISTWENQSFWSPVTVNLVIICSQAPIPVNFFLLWASQDRFILSRSLICGRIQKNLRGNVCTLLCSTSAIHSKYLEANVETENVWRWTESSFSSSSTKEKSRLGGFKTGNLSWSRRESKRATQTLLSLTFSLTTYLRGTEQPACYYCLQRKMQLPMTQWLD